MGDVVSIVVPVYNSAEYLDRCVKSICDQKYKDLNIILVDDGSTDGSSAKCDEWLKRDERIQVIHKENGGQQDARTEGIKVAFGEFIGFVDSDDWIDKEMISYLVDSAEGCDIVTSGYYEYTVDGRVRYEVYDSFSPGIWLTDQDEFLHNLFNYTDKDETKTTGIINSLCCKLFRLKTVKYAADKVNVGVKEGEDLLFTICCILMSKKICVTHRAFYHYRYNSNSVIRTTNHNYLADREKLYYSMLGIINELIDDKILEIQWQKFFIYMLVGSITQKMGMHRESRYLKYFFPWHSELNNKNVVIWGGGVVGQDYVYSIVHNNLCTILKWIDSNPRSCYYCGLSLESPESLSEVNPDYIVCAVNSEKAALEIKKTVEELGILEEKVLWMPPENLLKKIFLE